MCVTRYPTWVTDWLPNGEIGGPGLLQPMAERGFFLFLSYSPSIVR